MSAITPTKDCAIQFESQVNGYTNQGTNDIVHYISDGIVVAWIDFAGNPGGTLAIGGNILPLNNSWTGTNVFHNNVQGLRFYVNAGTAFSGSDSAIVISSGWGTAASVSNAAGYDPAFSFTVTAGAAPTANPTITITFKNGTWGTVPQYHVVRNDTNSPYWGVPHTIAVTATTLTITFNGLPIAGSAYSFICSGIGN